MKKSLFAIVLASAGFCALPALAQDTTSQDTTSQNAPSQGSMSQDSSSSMDSNSMSSMDSNPSTAGNYLPGDAVGHGRWFVNANVGQAHVFQGPYNNHPTTYALNGGYRWKVGQDMGLGLEVGYNDLGNYKLKNAFNNGDVNLKDRRNNLRGWTAGINAKINVWRGMYISGRGGVYGWKGDGYDNQSINRKHLDQVDYYAGAGVGYDISNNFSVGVAYDYFHARKDRVNLNNDTASVTAEYRF